MRLTQFGMIGCRIIKERVYQNARVEVSRREFLIVGANLIKGYLVEKVSSDAVVVKLSKVSPVTLSKEDYTMETERL